MGKNNVHYARIGRYLTGKLRASRNKDYERREIEEYINKKTVLDVDIYCKKGHLHRKGTTVTGDKEPGRIELVTFKVGDDYLTFNSVYEFELYIVRRIQTIKQEYPMYTDVLTDFEEAHHLLQLLKVSVWPIVKYQINEGYKKERETHAKKKN